jgi:hypothetical protein
MYPYATAPGPADRTCEGVDTSPTPRDGVEAAEEALDAAETDGGANRVLVALISLGGPNACTRPIFIP